MKKQTILPIVLMVFGIVVFLTAIIIGINLSARTQSQPNTAQPLVSEEESFPEIPRVTLQDALEANKSSSAVFIDVRDRSAYEAEHITGSLSYPLAQLASQLNELDPKAWIIPYCT